MSFNQIMILGNLTRDPEAGQMQDGTATSKFGIASNTKVKKEDVATFFRVNFIGRVAEVANEYLTKGAQAIVIGELYQENYTKNDGTPGTSLEVRGTKLQLLGGKADADAPKAKAAMATAKSKVMPEPEEDSIPF